MATGLIYPLTTLFLLSAGKLDDSGIALYFLVSAATSATSGLLAGRLIDRYTAKSLLVAGLVLESFGMLAMSSVGDHAPAISAAALLGAGNGAFFAALSPFMQGLETDGGLHRAFALRYWFINIASASGMLVGVGAIALAGEAAYRPLFAFDALACAVVALITSKIPCRPLGHAEPRDGERARSPFTKLGVQLVATQLLVVTCGIAFFEAVAPVIVTSGAGDSGQTAGLMMVASVVAVLGAQPFVNRLCQRTGPTWALRGHAAVWMVGALFAAPLLDINPQGGAIMIGLLFGLSECLFGPSFQSLVVIAAPESAQGRLNGMLSMTYGVGLAIGPAIGIHLATGDGNFAMWLPAIIGSAFVLLLWARPAGAEAPQTKSVSVP